MMENKMLKMVFAGVMALATAAAHAESTNSDGFCVRFGDKLVEANAIVQIRGSEIVNRPYLLLHERDHNFFDFNNGSPALHSNDWGGDFVLVKPAGDFIEGKNVALFTDSTHFGLDETLVVECRALGD
ncbi:MAG TPA: hypothetical protein VM901_12955 [Bdellovibrionota bacterium]|nr:hypothetical protein [Bdellovibrionota bacterium]